MKTIDSHHHLWQYSAEQYGWISDRMTALKKDFLLPELSSALSEGKIDHCVAVQARTSVEETRWLLKLAKQSPAIVGVVGWVDLTDPGVGDALVEFAAEPLLVGMRHTLQGEADARYMLREDFNQGIHALHGFGLAYDLLTKPVQLPHAPEFVDQHAGVPFVLDHIAKPEIKDAVPPSDWVAGIQDLAKRDNVACKLSGMATEVRIDTWDADLLRPYHEVVLEAFGVDRVMFGSDWPVCLLRSEYGRWAETVRGLIAELSDDEQAAIMGGNAAKVYGLEV